MILRMAALFLLVAPPLTLDGRLARWKPVQIPYDSATLTARQRQVIDKLVEASRQIEEVYWQQADPEALSLLTSTTDPKLRRLIRLNGSRFDLVDENRPFVGTQAIPPGRNLYPKGLTRAQIEAYVVKHPEQKAAIYSPYTVVKAKGSLLDTVPFYQEYGRFLQPAAASLRAAADLSDDPAFAKFLRLRAASLLNDDYYPSDAAWMELQNPKIDIIFGPNETYLDDVLGVKTAFESAILIRNEAESRKLDLYQRYVPDIQDALPVAAEARPNKRGHRTPMEVMDTPLRTGGMLHGYQSVADNLPNDPRIHQEKGTKKIFFRNFMEARVASVVLPLARYVMPADQAAKASGEGYLAAVVLHEICHGLGPDYARINGKQVDIREAIGPVFAALEEAKADVVGMFGLAWLMQHGALAPARSQEYYASYVAGIYRSVRYGTAEAHGRAEMMEFNYLAEHGAIQVRGGRYAVNYEKIPEALASLAKELLEQEASGDRKRAEAWFNKYDRMPGSLKALLDSAKDVPVDVEPMYTIEALPH